MNWRENIKQIVNVHLSSDSILIIISNRNVCGFTSSGVPVYRYVSDPRGSLGSRNIENVETLKIYFMKGTLKR